MAWIVGTRKKKRKLEKEGPKFYTECVLKKFIELSRSPVERAAYAHMLQLLKARKITAFKKFPGSIGLIESEALALVALENFLDAQLSELDAETKVKGKTAYVRKVRKAFSSLAKDISYKGKWDALASHLIRKAARMYGWKET